MPLLSFKDLLNSKYFDMNSIVKNIGSYLAHLPKLSNQKPEELLIHSNLVLKYAIKIMDDNLIEDKINKIISNISNEALFQNDIKLLFLKAIYWHDIGKINENFQVDKMSNSKYENIKSKISSKHSILSSYLYLISCLDYINKNYQDINKRKELISLSLVFSMSIWRHHGGLSKSLKELIIDENEGLLLCDELNIYLDVISLEIDKNIDFVLMKYIVKGDFKNQLNKKEEYYLLSKSLFSLLIISDYYATAQFMTFGKKEELVYNDFGLINEELKNKISKELYRDKFDEENKQLTFNEQLKDRTNKDFKSFCELREKSNENLNHLRNKLFVEIRTNLREELKRENSKNLFYIEAPTGAGKTNLSMMCMDEFLKSDESLNKVFYVFPFTTLITQTYSSIKTSLSLTNNELVQLHSKASYNEKDVDGVYGEKKTNFLDNQFMNYPISVLSHVKFFDILTGVSKNDNYIFHRLANSVVIIDEIQTYNPNFWSQIVYILDKYAKSFNIKFIVMSATLPKIGKIIDAEFCFLINRENKNKYFQNPNFGERVEIIIEKGKKDIKILFSKLLKESKNYQKLESNPRKKVKTIIEFITKKGADEFYQYALLHHKKFFDEIFILSGTVLETRRKEIIEFIKKNNDKNILLVTTQVVEAGVDIDMDIGFKEKSLVDSDEQLAGRINRNSSKKGNKLFLFEMKDSKVKYVYKSDKRKNISDSYIVNGKEQSVLNTKDFDKYYFQVIEKINEQNEIPFIENLNTYKDHLKNLRFEESHIKLIDMKSISVFIPLELTAELFEEDKDFLISLNLYDKNVISGNKVFDLYKSIIKNKEIDFIDKKIELKKLASIMSKFTFSLSEYKGSGVDNIKANYAIEEYGYLVLKDDVIAFDGEFNGAIIYTYKNGLDTRVLKGENVGMYI